MTPPRLLAIMGSGETAPTMVKVHRGLLDRLGRGREPTPAVLLDTPYAFQENAGMISARTVEYFGRSVGHDIEVASWRGTATGAGAGAERDADRDADGKDIVARERAGAAVRAARYVFAGPGSPTYALDRWAGSTLPALLADKLRRGGCVTFASAAALTLGVCTVPVYEIYKVGAEPTWRAGLDLLAAAGLRAAVIPHYDNTEGGNHDTRFCYLGERRLTMLEASLPEETFVLGVDEHTACVLDLEARTATVTGNGRVTVRRRGASESFDPGTTVPLDELAASGRRSPAGSAPPTAPDEELSLGVRAEADRRRTDLMDAIRRRAVDDAVAAVLELEQTIEDWSRDTSQSDETDRARAVLREMVVALGDLARTGAQDRRDVVGPFVDAMLEARARARRAGDYSGADELRDRLVGAGIAVNDSPTGTTWSMVAGKAPP